tara:strand:+ start:13562 stop:14452 length:891 start_codon:yes stop_codon:yes gene_type:complete
MREAWYVPYSPTVFTQTRVLVLAPHADDEVFGCGGTLALLAKAGARIEVVIISQGALAEQRYAESASAAALLRYPAPLQWSFDDRGLEAAREPLTEQLLAHLKVYQPTLVFAPSYWEMHPDHRATCDAALQAGNMYTRTTGAELSIALYEIGVPLVVSDLVDISSVSTSKQQAMQCFTSQLAEQRYAEQIFGLNTYRSYTLGLGVSAAEAFHLVDAAKGVDRGALPSQQDIALQRCENAYHAEFAAHHAQATTNEELRQRLAERDSQYTELRAYLDAILASRGWRWLTRLKRLLGR